MINSAQFSGHYDKCIHHLIERNKDDMAVVTGNIFSNLAVQRKNALVIMLIVRIGIVFRFCRFLEHYHISLCVRKPTICICENKDADQLRGNC